MDIATMLKEIAATYNIPEEELVSKYITQQQDLDNLPVPKIKDIIQRLGGDIKGKKKKQEWINMARQLLEGNAKTGVTETQLLCEVRQFEDRRCALHVESGRIFSIETSAEIGMWKEDKGPVFFNIQTES